MSEFDNMEMAEVYGRLSEALDMSVVVRENGSCIAVFDGGHVNITIGPDRCSLSAEGMTRDEKFEIGANARGMAEIIQRIISIEPYSEEDQPFSSDLSISEMNQDE